MVQRVDGEIGYPPWMHGLSRYGFASDGQVLTACFRGGIDYLPGYPDDTSFFSVRFSGGKLAFASVLWNREFAVHFDGQIVNTPQPLPDGYLQAPEIITFPTGSDGAEEAYALHYAPANPDYTATADEKQPPEIS